MQLSYTARDTQYKGIIVKISGSINLNVFINCVIIQDTVPIRNLLSVIENHQVKILERFGERGERARYGSTNFSAHRILHTPDFFLFTCVVIFDDVNHCGKFLIGSMSLPSILKS